MRNKLFFISLVPNLDFTEKNYAFFTIPVFSTTSAIFKVFKGKIKQCKSSHLSSS